MFIKATISGWKQAVSVPESCLALARSKCRVAVPSVCSTLKYCVRPQRPGVRLAPGTCFIDGQAAVGYAGLDRLHIGQAHLEACEATKNLGDRGQP